MSVQARTSGLAVMAALLLSGCEIKREAADEPEPAPADLAAPLQEAEPEPPASIIRQDAAPEPSVAERPEPLEMTIPFPDGGYELSDRANGMLEQLIASEQLAQGWPITLRGHTDSEGTDSGNLIASQKRAETVAGWLSDEGVEAERIAIIALGEQRPIAPNAKLDGTPYGEGRALNRRVDIWLGPPGTQPEEHSAVAGDTSVQGEAENDA